MASFLSSEEKKLSVYLTDLAPEKQAEDCPLMVSFVCMDHNATDCPRQARDGPRAARLLPRPARLPDRPPFQVGAFRRPGCAPQTPWPVHFETRTQRGPCSPCSRAIARLPELAPRRAEHQEEDAAHTRNSSSCCARSVGAMRLCTMGTVAGQSPFTATLCRSRLLRELPREGWFSS